MKLLLGFGWAALITLLLLSASRSVAGGPHRSARPPGRHGLGGHRRGRGGGAVRGGAIPPGDLALTCDLLAVAVGAGLTPLLALEAATGAAPPPIGDHLASVRAEVAAGAPLARALAGEAANHPGLRPMLELLVTSERSGAPVGPLLIRQAGEERAGGRRAALAQARKVPVRLLFPLVFLLLPAFLVLTVAPALIAGLQ